MRSFKEHSLSRCWRKNVHSAANLSRTLRTLALVPLGCFILLVLGCAHTGSMYGPLGLRSHRSKEAYRSNKDWWQGEKLGKTRIVTASWYGPGYEGKRTASGERFNSRRLSAASRKLPLDSIVRVTNLRNGSSVQVKINDRGPASRRRALDLSPAAARKIGLTNSGVARAKITPVSNTTD